MASRPLPSAASVPTTKGPFQPLREVTEKHVPHSLEQERAENRRQQEQEGEARSGIPVEPHEAPRGDRDPGTGDAGRERERLGEAHHDARGASPRSPIARSCGERSAHHRSERPAARRGAICHGSPRLSAIASSPRRPTTPAGIVATKTNQPMRSSGVSMRRSPDGVRERRHEPDDVAPEVRRDGDERAQVERDVERLVEAVVLLQVRPVGAPRARGSGAPRTRSAGAR